MKPSIALACTLTASIAEWPADAATLPPGDQIQASSPTVSVSVSNSGTIVGTTPTKGSPQTVLVHMAGSLRCPNLARARCCWAASQQ